MLNIDKLSYWEQKTFFNAIDFLIVGAGIVGYSTALALKSRFPDSKILIAERGILPSGASSKNAGFACFGSVTEILADIETFGPEKVWQTVALRWKGVNRLRDLIGDESLKLEINGSWDLIRDDEKSNFHELSSKLNYLNDELFKITGEKDVYSVDDDIEGKFGMKGIYSAFYNRLEGQIDTGAMNQKFYELVVSKEIHTLFGLEISSINDENSQLSVESNIGVLNPKKVIVCTNGFAKKLLPDEDVSPARAQVLITKPIEHLKIKGTFHYQEGYYYFRNIDKRILFGGGRNLALEEEETTSFENTELIMNKLQEILREVILPQTQFEIDHYWSGVMGVGANKKPIVKRISDNVYCGVRLGGMGVAIGSLVGEELAEKIKNDLA